MLEYFKRLYAKDSLSFYEEVEKSLKNKRRMFIVTANPETFSYGEKSENFNKLLLDQKTTLIPDGIGIVKFNVKERITGIDLATKLLEICNKNKYKLCLIGAKEEVLQSLIAIINKNYPNIKLGTCENGYINNKDSYFEKIKKEKPDVCLVALGIPNQEELIYKHIEKFEKGVFVGVGGSFDVLSGSKKRAPKLIQKMNIEWLYRIIKEPKRIKRFYNNNVKFIFKVKKLKNL